MVTGKIPIYFTRVGMIELVDPIEKSEEEWKRILSPMTFEVARKSGTEAAFTGVYHDTHREGIYQCACCGTDLFDSRHKFDSGTGWPSFSAPVAKENLRIQVDQSHGMARNEVLCSRCRAHLGHVFDDGPSPTFMRYCMNSASLMLVPR
ncbi:MAG: peptide-methionine (R)-S-oxide reductase MsrB [Methanoregulaceae archaeon]